MTVVLQGFSTTACSQFADTFRRDGFGVVRGAIGAEHAARMRADLSQLLSAGEQLTGHPLEADMPRIVEKHSDFAALAIAPPLISTLTELFGTVPHLVASYGHVKPARTSAHTGTHSDIAHLRGVPHHDSTLMIKVMYALTPVGHDSGATLVYPGTHKLPATEQAELEREDSVRILLEPGDMQLFHANLLHTATANLSDRPRLSVWFVYAQPWMRTFPGHQHTSHLLKALSKRIESDPALAPVFGLPNPYSTRD